MSQQCTESTREAHIACRPNTKQMMAEVALIHLPLMPQHMPSHLLLLSEEGCKGKKRMEVEKNVVSLASGHDPMNIHSS